MGRRKPSTIIIARAAWPEAEVVQEPVRERDLTDPLVIVRRVVPDIAGPKNERLFVVHGAGTHISLFTGCGGMDLGCEQAGFMTVVQHEWDRTCCETLLSNRPNCFRHSALIQGDLTKTPTHMILGAAGLRVGEADLLTGGPPCQGFSTAGKRAAGDIRDTLVYEFLRVVREAQPRFFVMENVPGFLSKEKGRFFRGFLEEAYGAYYELVYGLVNAVEYGVPQDRCRFICMGTRRDLVECDGLLGSLPRPTHFSPRDCKEVAYLERRPLLLPDLEEFTHPPGIRYFPDRPILIPPRPTSRASKSGNIAGRAKGFLAFYDKLRRTEPDRLVAVPVEGNDFERTAKDNWDAGRWITVRDAISDLEAIEPNWTGVVNHG